MALTNFLLSSSAFEYSQRFYVCFQTVFFDPTCTWIPNSRSFSNQMHFTLLLDLKLPGIH